MSLFPNHFVARVTLDPRPNVRQDITALTTHSEIFDVVNEQLTAMDWTVVREQRPREGNVRRGNAIRENTRRRNARLGNAEVAVESRDVDVASREPWSGIRDSVELSMQRRDTSLSRKKAERRRRGFMGWIRRLLARC